MKVVRNLIVLFVLGICFSIPGVCKASNASIEFGTSSTNVKAGNTFVVNMVIETDTGMSDVELKVSYDSGKMNFISGGRYVTGGDGLLTVSIPGVGGAKTNITVPLTFKAVNAGSGSVNLATGSYITGGDGSDMEVESNKISVVIGESNWYTGTSLTDLSDNNRLTSLSVSSGTLDPVFSPEKKKYSITVDCNTDTIYFTYKAEDPKAAVSFVGNEGLKPGKNSVMVTVTAQNGATRDYIIKVKKETEAQTKKRLEKEGITGGIGFEVTAEKGAVFIKNNYRFKVIDVDEDAEIPAGYRKTTVLLYGVNVTAYTMANDLENEFLIMYCMNENGDKDFYQFDRQEKSLQRYTGTLIDRVNKTAENEGETVVSYETAEQYHKNLRQMAIIIALLCALSVFLVLCMISMALNRIRKKSTDVADEIEF